MGGFDNLRQAGRVSGNYIIRRCRELTPSELSVARRVFGGSLPYPTWLGSRIAICDDLGWNNRPWTEPKNMMATTVYELHLGPAGFANTIGMQPTA